MFVGMFLLIVNDKKTDLEFCFRYRTIFVFLDFSTKKKKELQIFVHENNN